MDLWAYFELPRTISSCQNGQDRRTDRQLMVSKPECTTLEYNGDYMYGNYPNALRKLGCYGHHYQMNMIIFQDEHTTSNLYNFGAIEIYTWFFLDNVTNFLSFIISKSIFHLRKWIVRNMTPYSPLCVVPMVPLQHVLLPIWRRIAHCVLCQCNCSIATCTFEIN